MDDLLNSSELDSIISKINLDSFKEEVKIKNETRGRKQTVVINPYFSVFNEIKKYEHLQGWVDDVLNGAARLATDNSHTTADLLFHLLKHLPSITTAEIKSHINRKRSIAGYNPLTSDRYCRWIRSRLDSAIKSLDYHLERGKTLLIDDKFFGSEIFDAKADMIGYLADKDTRKPITTDQLLNNLLLAGLDIHEATNYINGRPISA